MNTIRKLHAMTSSGIGRSFSFSATYDAKYSCKLLILGGGSGGCPMAAKFARRLTKDAVIVLEPNTDHYYQPLWTLVGAGVSNVEETRRLEVTVLPKDVKWVQDYAQCVLPDDNMVKTREGHDIHYEYLIIAVGVDNDYEKVPGLYEALEDKNSGVSSIFAAKYCENTWSDINNFRRGNAVFTYPDTPIKCAGAPQKIAYLADSHFRRANVRSKTNVVYYTCLPVIFGVKKYADELLKVVKRKNIEVHYRTVLKEVRHDKREAVFYHKKDRSKEFTICYDMLHATPPMYTPEFLRYNELLADDSGYLDVDMYTLQHKKYPNIYGIGDCTNTPNSKTAAAIAKQSYVLELNLLSTMKNDCPKEKYNGYGACPLLTSYSTCILAEFLYDGVIRETMPFNQARESRIAFYMKRYMFPFIYWHLMMKGYYHGPEFVRSLLHPFQD